MYVHRCMHSCMRTYMHTHIYACQCPAMHSIQVCGGLSCLPNGPIIKARLICPRAFRWYMCFLQHECLCASACAPLVEPVHVRLTWRGFRRY